MANKTHYKHEFIYVASSCSLLIHDLISTSIVVLFKFHCLCLCFFSWIRPWPMFHYLCLPDNYYRNWSFSLNSWPERFQPCYHENLSMFYVSIHITYSCKTSLPVTLTEITWRVLHCWRHTLTTYISSYNNNKNIIINFPFV